MAYIFLLQLVFVHNVLEINDYYDIQHFSYLIICMSVINKSV